MIALTGRRGDRYRGLLQAARGAITPADAARVLHGVRLHIQIAGNRSADTSDANVPDTPVAGGAVDDRRLQRGHHVRLAQAVKSTRIFRGLQICRSTRSEVSTRVLTYTAR